jgi:hypothetical protein
LMTAQACTASARHKQLQGTVWRKTFANLIDDQMNLLSPMVFIP